MFLERAALLATMTRWDKGVSAQPHDFDADGNEFHADIAGCNATRWG